MFSFADILSYRKVQANLQKAHINYVDWQEEQMREFAHRLSELNLNGDTNWLLVARR